MEITIPLLVVGKGKSRGVNIKERTVTTQQLDIKDSSLEELGQQISILAQLTLITIMIMY